MSRYVDQNDNLSIHGGNDIHLDVDQKCQVKKKKKKLWPIKFSFLILWQWGRSREGKFNLALSQPLGKHFFFFFFFLPNSNSKVTWLHTRQFTLLTLHFLGFPCAILHVITIAALEQLLGGVWLQRSSSFSLCVAMSCVASRLLSVCLLRKRSCS